MCLELRLDSSNPEPGKRGSSGGWREELYRLLIFVQKCLYTDKGTIVTGGPCFVHMANNSYEG